MTSDRPFGPTVTASMRLAARSSPVVTGFASWPTLGAGGSPGPSAHPPIGPSVADTLPGMARGAGRAPGCDGGADAALHHHPHDRGCRRTQPCGLPARRGIRPASRCPPAGAWRARVTGRRCRGLIAHPACHCRAQAFGRSQCASRGFLRWIAWHWGMPTRRAGRCYERAQKKASRSACSLGSMRSAKVVWIQRHMTA